MFSSYIRNVMNKTSLWYVLLHMSPTDINSLLVNPVGTHYF